MRRSVIAAGAAGIGSLVSDLVAGERFSDGKFVGFAGATLLLALLSGVETLAPIVDLFAYFLVAAVVLNDGARLLQVFGG